MTSARELAIAKALASQHYAEFYDQMHLLREQLAKKENSMLPEFRERTQLGKLYTVKLTCAENNAWIQYILTDKKAAAICYEMDYAIEQYRRAASNPAPPTRKKFFSLLHKVGDAQLAFIHLADEWVKNNVKAD
jgi:hypothetical protein